jgi:branched-chain amino acid transport system substrate-binding protein
MRMVKSRLHMLKLFFALLTVFSSSAFAEEVFRVGVIAPLSGPLAEYGLASQNGITLAKKQHPELYSKVEFIYEDSQWDAKAAVTAFNSLRIQKHVNLVYNWGNPTTEAVVPLAEQHHMPLIALTLDPTVAKGRNFVIRTINPAGDFASISADYVKHKGFKNIGIIIAENTYVQGLFNGLQNSLGDAAKIEIIDSYNIQDQDFRSSISKIRTKKYDSLGVFLISGQVSSFYRQLQSQPTLLPSIGTDFFESTTEIKLANGGMNGAVYPHLGITEEFKKDYTTQFNNDYQIAYAGNAYDMAMVIGEQFGGLTAPISGDEIMLHLKAIKNKDGIGGIFSFQDTSDGGPHYHFPPKLKKIVGDSIIKIDLND